MSGQLIPKFPAICAESLTCAQQLATGTHKMKLSLCTTQNVWGVKLWPQPFLIRKYMDLNGQFHGQAALPPRIGPSTPGTDCIQGCGGIQSRFTGRHTLEKIKYPVPAQNRTTVQFLYRLRPSRS
jgi:hypothetical protein